MLGYRCEHGIIFRVGSDPLATPAECASQGYVAAAVQCGLLAGALTQKVQSPLKILSYEAGNFIEPSKSGRASLGRPRPPHATSRRHSVVARS